MPTSTTVSPWGESSAASPKGTTRSTCTASLSSHLYHSIAGAKDAKINYIFIVFNDHDQLVESKINWQSLPALSENNW